MESEESKMELTEQFNSIYTKLESILELIHCNIFNNFSVTHPIFIAFIIDVIMFVPVNVYSIWYFSDKLLEVAYCITTAGFGIQGLTKFKVFLLNRHDIVNLKNDITRFHQSNEQLDKRIKCALYNKQKLCIKFCDFLGYTYNISGVAVTLLPMLTSMYLEKRILPFGFVLPFLDHTSSPGYEINFAYQILKVLAACLGLRCSDIMYISFILNNCIQMEAINQILVKLNEIVDDNKITQRNNKEIKLILLDIIKRHQKQLKFARNLNDIFSIHFVIVIVNIMMQIILILVVVTFVTWYSGYFLLILSLSQLFIICALGTIYSIQCDSLESYIYDVKWYCFKIEDQKIILQLLTMAQNPVKQSIGGAGQLNLQTFLLIMKGIYSFVMMLVNFM